jgi:uncharacterized protein (TIGR02246 family)
MTRTIYVALLAVPIFPCSAHAQQPGEPDASRLIAEWNAAYRALDATALAALFTADVEIIDRFGHWVKSQGTLHVERLWQQTFTDIYSGKPGPARKFEGVRMLSADVMVVQASAQWDAVRLEDGTTIPPHGEIDTFVAVRRNGA